MQSKFSVWKSFIPTAVAAMFTLAGCGGNSTPTSVTQTGQTVVDNGQSATLDTNTGYKITNVSTGTVLGLAAPQLNVGAAVLPATDAGTTDQLWHAVPMGTQQYNMENLLSHELLGITSASTAEGAAAVQWADNGTNDHVFFFLKLNDGNYLIQNSNSKLFLQVDTTVSPNVVSQGARPVLGTACKCQEWSLTANGKQPYPNPLTVAGNGIYVHDPNMIQDASGTFWLYGTHNTLAYSTDMVHFTPTTTGDFATDFPWWAGENTTGGNGRTDIWAPSVMFANGKYYQYYSLPVFDTPGVVGTNQGAEAVIALATSSSPSGPWTDAGQIIASCGNKSGCTTKFNAIDPAPFIDATGKWWMSFGSFEDGLHVLQLDPTTGLRLASNTTIYDIAYRGGGEEGSFIYPKVVNGTQYYYYFAPVNICCSASSAYRIVAGRSTSPTGPFFDRGGLDLRLGGGTLLLTAHGNIVGPGGQSVLTVGNQTVLVYHYYDSNNNGTPTLGLNYITFDASGWPSVQ